jgi:hypothetical protein
MRNLARLAACENEPFDHFRDSTKMVEIGKGGQRPVEDSSVNV